MLRNSGKFITKERKYICLYIHRVDKINSQVKKKTNRVITHPHLGFSYHKVKRVYNSVNINYMLVLCPMLLFYIIYAQLINKNTYIGRHMQHIYSLLLK